ncbi:MAG: flagellar basal body P-ring formation protein FlgA [Sedimentisphaerales bacterium]|nr:flagellar basal body P-ring formation protein FlgA [Sedimentisphaerales bacterium]
MITMLSGRVWGRDAIRMRDQANTAHEAVRLTDIADIVTADEDLLPRLEQLVVLTFTEGMVQADISMFDINRALAQAGMQPATFDIYGASYCAISRDVASPTKDQGENNERERRQPTQPPFDGAAAPEGGGNDFSEGRPTLAASLEAIVRKAAPCEENRLRVEWDEGDKDYLAQACEADQFEIRPRGRVGLGEICFEVRSKDPEGKEQRRLVEGKVWCMCEMVTAQRTINAGKTISAKDVTVTAQKVMDLREVGLQDAAAVVGQAARRTIRAQQVIGATDLMKVLLVRRNDTVEVSTRIGAVSVHRQATALGDGGLGETISVRDTDNHIVIQGKVAGPGAVVVDENVKVAPLIDADKRCADQKLSCSRERLNR